MVTLHTVMIDDNNAQNTRKKDTPDLHNTHNTLTKRSQQTRNADKHTQKTHNAQKIHTTQQHILQTNKYK